MKLPHETKQQRGGMTPLLPMVPVEKFRYDYIKRNFSFGSLAGRYSK